uniref:Uncharacterized protein n=1 Tax=Anopheles atroparvus TaxID=41427 RepID=A0AAG5D2C4_ANOAO
ARWEARVYSEHVTCAHVLACYWLGIIVPSHSGRRVQSEPWRLRKETRFDQCEFSLHARRRRSAATSFYVVSTSRLCRRCHFWQGIGIISHTPILGAPTNGGKDNLKISNSAHICLTPMRQTFSEWLPKRRDLA